MTSNLAPSGRVFRLGLSRTGTKSLAAALNTAGVRTQWYPSDSATFEELLSGRYRLSVLEQYQAITDTPVVPFYKQFDALFPQSKFILTVRKKAAWLDSCRRHWTRPQVGPEELYRGTHQQRFGRYIDTVVDGSPNFEQARWGQVYDDHIADVKQTFRDRPDDLLIMDITAGDGWEQLCPFLGLAPRTGPFPLVNAFNHELLGRT